jgi:hypothetical protein
MPGPDYQVKADQFREKAQKMERSAEEATDATIRDYYLRLASEYHAIAAQYEALARFAS